MQKISTYLYPNRIQLLANLAGFTTEYTNVYQRTVNLFKGIDNTLEFDIINADQKRIDLTGLTLTFTMMDTEGNQILQKEIEALNQLTNKGLAKVVILASELMDLLQQYFRYSVYAENTAGDQIMLYGDTRFGVKGTIELKGDVMPTPQPDKVTTLFNPLTTEEGETVWTSAGISAQTYAAVPNTLTTMFIYVTGLTGTVDVQVSLDANLTNSTTWTTLESINVTPNQTIIQRNIEGMYNWFRVSYVNGSTVYAPVTGSVDKLIIRS